MSISLQGHVDVKGADCVPRKLHLIFGCVVVANFSDVNANSNLVNSKADTWGNTTLRIVHRSKCVRFTTNLSFTSPAAVARRATLQLSGLLCYANVYG